MGEVAGSQKKQVTNQRNYNWQTRFASHFVLFKWMYETIQVYGCSVVGQLLFHSQSIRMLLVSGY